MKKQSKKQLRKIVAGTKKIDPVNIHAQLRRVFETKTNDLKEMFPKKHRNHVEEVE